jgi:hypothetical protein
MLGICFSTPHTSPFHARRGTPEKDPSVARLKKSVPDNRVGGRKVFWILEVPRSSYWYRPKEKTPCTRLQKTGLLQLRLIEAGLGNVQIKKGLLIAVGFLDQFSGLIGK